jgi:peptide/nickel transport system ATP-binding protein
MAAAEKPLLIVDDLHVDFVTHEGVVRAVRGVDFTIGVGEKLGVVGESGCGKSVTSLAIMRLVPRPKGRISKGHIWLYRDGLKTDMVPLGYDSSAMRSIRGKELTMIFQEPMTSLNPCFTVGAQIVEAIQQHERLSSKQAREGAISALHSVGMPDPKETVDRYPHQLSGGMRQRVMIAMAIALAPRLLIADEPTTALDVTVQAQILDLVNECQAKYGMSLMWITHNLGVVGELCDNVIVMYLGEIVEYATVAEIFKQPLHPYTQGLLSCAPQLGADVKRELVPIGGVVPGPFDIPSGCSFAPRCAHRFAKCDQAPPLFSKGGRQVRCWLYE